MVQTLPTLRLPHLLIIAIHHAAAVGLDPASDAARHDQGLQVTTNLPHVVLQPSSTPRAAAKRRAFTFWRDKTPPCQLPSELPRAEQYEGLKTHHNKR